MSCQQKHFGTTILCTGHLSTFFFFSYLLLTEKYIQFENAAEQTKRINEKEKSKDKIKIMGYCGCCPQIPFSALE